MELTVEDLIGEWVLCGWCMVPEIREDEHPEAFEHVKGLGWVRARAALPTWGWQPVTGSRLTVGEDDAVTEALEDPEHPPQLPWRGVTGEPADALAPFRSVAWMKPTEGFASLSWFDEDGQQHNDFRRAQDDSTVQDSLLLDDDGTLVRRQDVTRYAAGIGSAPIAFSAVLLRYRRISAPHPSAQEQVPSVGAINRWWAEHDARYEGCWDLVAIHEDPMILDYMDERAYLEAHRTHMIPTMRDLLAHPWRPISQADPHFAGMRLRIDGGGHVTEQAVEAAPGRFWDVDAECGSSRQMPFEARLHRVRREDQFTLALPEQLGTPGIRQSFGNRATDTIHVPEGAPERLVRAQSIEQRDEGILIRVHFLYEKADPNAPVTMQPRTLSAEEIAAEEDPHAAAPEENAAAESDSAGRSISPERRSDEDLEPGMLWVKPDEPGYRDIALSWSPTPVRYPSLSEGVDVTDRIPLDMRETNCAYWRERIAAVGQGVRGVRATMSRIVWGIERTAPCGNWLHASFHPEPRYIPGNASTWEERGRFQVMAHPRPVGEGPVPSPFDPANRTLPAWLQHELLPTAEPSIDGHRCVALVVAFHLEHGLRVLAFQDEAAIALHASQHYRLEDPLDLQLFRLLEETA